MEKKYYDLSAAQKILLLSQKYTLHKQVNNVCTSILMDTELDFEILRKAIQKAYERNDSLRVRLIKLDKEVKQYFLENEEPYIDYLDFRGKSLEQMEDKLYKIASKPITGFGKQLSKVYMFHSFDGRCGIYFAVSHMILDSWAITTFFKDVLALYDTLINHTDLPKPLYSYEELLIKDLDYKNTETYKKDLEFWKETLNISEPIFTDVNGSSVLEKYRTKHKNPNLRYAQIFSLFTKAKNVMLSVPKELVASMEEFCTSNKLPMQSLVLLAYSNYFSKVNNNENDISIHTVVARRGTLREKNSGGTRVHFMPLRIILNGTHTFNGACELISEKQNEIYRHSSISPLEIMDLWHELFNIPQIGTYFSTSLTFQPVKLVSPNGVKIETKWYGNGAAANPLYLTVMDGDGTGSLKFYYEYQTHKISFDTIQKLHAHMLKVFEAGTSNPYITIDALLNID
ncbi:condensation domain-containing protein [Clostridium folliculivorans]|uniref:Condensation domain-containing protein n=1 Tax=Clostridium folliculivorans TaxID=2886038 RepID=A0A9W5Y3J2_9CLOT|nr:condensation domain-containing protein [Clostridium folliculivorans]GKU25880.1 hypothetical protein CFOLD11_27060 [Clostridium folliculivorans]GKU27966.1 hypothetical protein CFB3_00720 [Clostridium folliculivorans]